MLYLNTVCNLVRFHLRKDAVDSGQIKKKVKELVSMDPLVHTELLYRVRLQSRNKTAEGAYDRRLQNPKCHGSCGSEKLFSFSLLPPSPPIRTSYQIALSGGIFE